MTLAMLTHAIRMVWTNRSDAIRLTMVPYLVVQAFSLGLPLAIFGDISGPSFESAVENPAEFEQAFGDFALVQMLALIGSTIAGAWLAVVWHRYVLLEEYPDAYVPAFTPSLVFSYVGRLIAIGLVMLFVGLIGGVGVATFAAVIPFAGFLVGSFLVAIILWLSIRWSIILPAAAIGRPMWFSEAWDKTKDVHPAMLGASILLALFCLALAAPFLLLMYVGGEGMSLGWQILGNLIYGWVAAILTASMATTFYGVAVEGRTLS